MLWRLTKKVNKRPPPPLPNENILIYKHKNVLRILKKNIQTASRMNYFI